MSGHGHGHRRPWKAPEGATTAVPYHCPFCAEADLHPVADPEAWLCRACRRTFAVVAVPVPAGGPAPAPIRSADEGDAQW